MATRPVIGIVMLIDPQQAIHVTHIRLEHDAAHIVVDPYRAHVRIGSITNAFVIDAACRRVLTKLGDEGQHRLLVRARNC
ncbi:hypothetical protein D3C87_1594270 [compost metagenome]